MTRFIDLSGLKCPIPVLRLKKELSKERAGSIIRVITTDPATPKDFEIFCNKSGDKIIEYSQHSDNFIFRIKKIDN